MELSEGDVHDMRMMSAVEKEMNSNLDDPSALLFVNSITATDKLETVMEDSEIDRIKDFGITITMMDPEDIENSRDITTGNTAITTTNDNVDMVSTTWDADEHEMRMMSEVQNAMKTVSDSDSCGLERVATPKQEATTPLAMLEGTQYDLVMMSAVRKEMNADMTPTVSMGGNQYDFRDKSVVKKRLIDDSEHDLRMMAMVRQELNDESQDGGSEMVPMSYTVDDGHGGGQFTD